MKSKISLLVLSTILFTCSLLFTINYFTLFGYYLPHKQQIIDTDLSHDIFRESHPSYMVITTDSEESIWELTIDQENNKWRNLILL